MGGRNTDSIETEGTGTVTGTGSDPSTAGTGGVRGRSGRGTGRSTKSETVVLEQDLVKPVTVDLPGKDKTATVDKDEEKKAKARERQRAYREKKKGTSAASTTKKSTASKADATQLKFLLLTISNVMATRPGMEMWQLTPAEVDSIAQPLSNMMAKNEAVTQALEEHGDALALITAVAMIAFPRVMMMMAQRKETPTLTHPAVEEVKNNATSKRGNNAKSSDTDGTNDSRSGTNAGGSTASRQVPGGSLHSIVPAIGFGY